MKKALLYIVSSIVDNPKKVDIEEKEEDGIIQFTINLAQEDMGKVIGKEGKVIRAIRNVLKIAAIKQGKRINITLAENLP
ncbi:MAG: KH domain-containing protein [Candidatus Levyibacteriota bacterium]